MNKFINNNNKSNFTVEKPDRYCLGWLKTTSTVINLVDSMNFDIMWKEGHFTLNLSSQSPIAPSLTMKKTPGKPKLRAFYKWMDQVSCSKVTRYKDRLRNCHRLEETKEAVMMKCSGSERTLLRKLAKCDASMWCSNASMWISWFPLTVLCVNITG